MGYSKKLRPPKRKDHYRNPAEEEFRKLAETRGWIITKRGWLDFICWSPTVGFFFVEVKKHKRQRMSFMQCKVHQTFHAHGILSGKWSPDDPTPRWLP